MTDHEQGGGQGPTEGSERGTAAHGAGKGTKSRRGSRDRRAGNGRSTAAEVAARVEQVRGLVLLGYRTTEMHRLCVRASLAEADLWRRWRAENVGKPAAERAPEPNGGRRVWGDSGADGVGPTSRTVDGYIARAKRLIDGDARAVKGDAGVVLGIILARNAVIFRRALKAGKYEAANRATEILMRLFGLEGAIKLAVELTTPPGQPLEHAHAVDGRLEHAVEHSGRVETTPAASVASTSEAQRAVEIVDLFRKAEVARARALGMPVGRRAADLMPGAPAPGGSDG